METPGAREQLRGLPKVDEVLRRPEVIALGATSPRWAVVEVVRRAIERQRRAILAGEAGTHELDLSAPTLAAEVAVLARPSLGRVVNATGVVLHTNLGRAPLATRAIERIAEVARGDSNLEYEVGEGTRGSRHEHLRALLCALTGAESAIVVNNNAAAVLVALAALAAGREVIVSRGELIEIGGSFRIPDVMRASGARLCEVGTTNKTHARDVEEAIGQDTALILKVHRSNFAIIGFTEEVAVVDLAAIGAGAHVPVMVDLGSGALVDTRAFGLPAEPTVAAQISAGADVVTFSGDKLLGGPQAGIIVGREAALAKIRHHPLMRAVRPDKLTLAALEATLELIREDRAADIPALRMLASPLAELEARARRLAELCVGAGITVELASVQSAVGGGALDGGAAFVGHRARDPGALGRAPRRRSAWWSPADRRPDRRGSPAPRRADSRRRRAGRGRGGRAPAANRSDLIDHGRRRPLLARLRRGARGVGRRDVPRIRLVAKADPADGQAQA